MVINVRITTGALNYEETLHNLFPMLADKLRGADQDHTCLRVVSALIDKLGGDAETVAVRLIQYLPKQSKDELVCQIVSSYESILIEKLNEVLLDNEIGRSFQIKTIKIQRTGVEGLDLLLGGVEADMKQLLYNETILAGLNSEIQKKLEPGILGKLSAKAAMAALCAAGGLPNDEMERAGAALLTQPAIKNMVLDKTQQLLSSKSIVAPLTDLCVEPNCEAEGYIPGGAHPPERSAELEEALLTALAQYLKDNLTH